MGNANLGDPRVKRTRKLIQQAFSELLAAKDFEDVSVQDIMARAELNRATFYNHYQDKYELLELMLSEAFAETLAKWIPAGADPKAPDLLRNLMMAVCEWQVDTARRLNARRTISRAMEESAKRQLYNVILSCIFSGSQMPVHERQRVERIATMIGWSIVGAVVKWSESRDESAERFVESVLPLLLSNLDTLEFEA